MTCAKNALEIASIVHRTDLEKKLKQKLAAYEAQALEAKEMNVVQYLSLKTAHDEASSDGEATREVAATGSGAWLPDSGTSVRLMHRRE